MRKILVVGAGQSGLLLAHGLLKHGYDVTLLTGRTSHEVRYGQVAPGQLTFPTVLRYEQTRDLDFWEGQAPLLTTVAITRITDQGETVDSFTGHIPGGGVCMDSRIKMADWLEAFEDRGGRVTVHGATVTDLDYFTRLYDLVVVAVGSGELGRLFTPDPSRSSGGRPVVTVDAYVQGARVRHNDRFQIAFVEGLGMLRLDPALTPYGPGHRVALHTGPGATLDFSGERLKPDQQFQRLLGIFAEYAPHMYEQLRDVRLVDEQSVNIDLITSYVRDPVGELPSGGVVLGMADVVFSSEPLAMQSWNNSTACAHVYLNRIVEHADRPFDADFMRSAFADYWEYARYTAWLANLLTRADLENTPSHVRELLARLGRDQEVNNLIFSGLDDPRKLAEKLATPQSLAAHLS